MPFNDLFGNRRIKRVLISYLRNRMVPPAMLFSGGGSVNLKGFALGFAKALNCRDRKDDFCGACANCRDIDREMFPDVRLLRPDGQQYKKEQVDFIVEDQVRRPLQGERKVYILESAQRLSESSANAFLKALEEPSEATVFMLLTPSLSGILPTIQSRCQVLRFTPPAPEDIRKYLLEQGMEAEKATLLSRLSQSQRLDVIHGDHGEVLEARRSVLDVLTSLLRHEGEGDVLVELNNLNRRREAFIGYFRELVNLISLFLRDIMVLKAGGDDSLLFNMDFKEELMTLCQYSGEEKLMYLVRRMETLLRDVQRNLNAKVLTQEFIRSFTDQEPGIG
ncbi:MAG TPA: hypothetical protein ENN40_06435 [Candidatus Aminicenantes bacterium]|nr:hypothetical protein [Candidatus Aminicenantes bacterium]